MRVCLYSACLVLLSSISTVGFAQNETLVPYRKGELWGLADTNVNVVVVPAYDSIITSYRYPKGYYVVERNGKKGVITRQKVIVEPSLEYVTFRNDFIFNYFSIPVNNYQRVAQIYSLKGNLALTDTIRNVHKIYQVEEASLYEIILPNGDTGVVVYDDSSYRISQWLVKGYRSIYPMKLNNKYILKCRTKSGGYDTYKVHIKNRTDVTAIPLNQVQSKQVDAEIDEYYEDEMVEVDELIDFEEGDGLAQLDLQNGRIQCLLDKKTYFITKKTLSNEREVRNKSAQPIYKIDTLSSGSISKKKRWLMEYEHAFGPIEKQYYTIRTNHYWSRRNPVRPINYIEFTVKNKHGIINEFGTIPAQFDSIISYAPLQEQLPYYIVGIRSAKSSPLKYGLVKADSTWLIPVAADAIRPYIFNQNYREVYRPYTFGFFVKNGGNESLVRWDGETLLSGYDSLIPFASHVECVITQKNGKYGFYSRLTQIPAIHDYIPLGYGYVNGNTYVELYDKDLRFLGYAKKTGELFFED